MKSIDLDTLEVRTFKEHYNKLCETGGEFLGGTNEIEIDGQTLPPLYFYKSNEIELKGEHIARGMFLTIVSCQNKLIFSYEFYTNQLHEFYERAKNYGMIFYQIDRSEIKDYQKIGRIESQVVIPSKTVKKVSEFKVAPFGGSILSKVIFSGLRKKADKEPELGIRQTICYRLNYKSGNNSAFIDILCLPENKDFFENQILDKHWTIEAPEKPVIPQNSNCYIATTCYGNPNHEDVVFLRYFREYFLEKLLIGNIFSKWYSTYGSEIANKYFANKMAKGAFKLLFLKPFIKILRLLLPTKRP